MSKNNENKLVPKLRFPEFVNDGEWDFDTAENLISTISPPKKLNSSEYLEFGKFPIVDQSQKFYCGWTNDREALIKNDFPLIIFGDHTCILKLVNEPFAQGADGIKIIKPNKSVTTEYLYHFLYLNGVQQENYKRHFSILKDKVVLYPDIKTGEQQKIAACLSSLDEVITAESQKLDILKDHKKGLLQNLFPQEGETVPKLRFKEFEGSGEWLSDILKNVFTIFQGFAFSSNDSVSTGVRWLKIADVGIQQMNHLSPSYLPYEFKEKYENFLVKEGDYVIALTRPILNKKLKISKVDNTLHDSLLNQRVGKLVSNKCIDFVYYLIQTSKLVSSIEQNIAGSEPPNLSAQQIENIEVFIPPTIKEQQKIASCLYSIDELINAQNQKLETLKLHKKGLLQGLFPGVNET